MAEWRHDPLVWIGVALVAVVALMVAFAATAPSGGYGWMMGGGMGWGMVFMVIPGIILLLVLLAALGAFSERHVHAVYPPYTAYPSPPVSTTTAVDMLDQRYARGELSREEYLKMRADLTQR